MNTDTPLTNSATFEVRANNRAVPIDVVAASFAEGLERELNASKAEVERLTEKLTSLQEAYLQSVERDNNLTQALFDSRAEVKRLTELLEFSQEKPIY